VATRIQADLPNTMQKAQGGNGFIPLCLTVTSARSSYFCSTTTSTTLYEKLRGNTHIVCSGEQHCGTLPTMVAAIASWIARFLEPSLPGEHIRLPLNKLLIKGFCCHLPRSDG
jgi:hypothetical protein